MSYGTPVTSESADYTVWLKNDASGTNNDAVIEVTMTPGDGTWTQAGLDTLFQQLLDLLDGAAFLAPLSGTTLEAGKRQGTSTTVTPTP